MAYHADVPCRTLCHAATVPGIHIHTVNRLEKHVVLSSFILLIGSSLVHWHEARGESTRLLVIRHLEINLSYEADPG